MDGSQDTAARTLSMLEDRLQRIEYAINGDTNTPTESSQSNRSASTRLRNLERTLRALTVRSHAVADVLHLQRQYPELFHPISAKTVPNTLPQASLAHLVLAHEPTYRKTNSQLSTLNESSDVPDSAPLVALIGTQSRLDKLEARQAAQAKEFAELRARSARAVEQWYESGVLDMGEKWADWEERLRDCEILVRRNEAAKSREEGIS